MYGRLKTSTLHKLCAALLLSHTIVIFAADAADMLTASERHMLAAIDQKKNTVVDIEKKIWEYRELGMEEFKSSELLMDMLEKEGFSVQRGVTVGRIVI